MGFQVSDVGIPAEPFSALPQILHSEGTCRQIPTPQEGGGGGIEKASKHLSDVRAQVLLLFFLCLEHWDFYYYCYYFNLNSIN